MRRREHMTLGGRGGPRLESAASLGGSDCKTGGAPRGRGAGGLGQLLPQRLRLHGLDAQAALDLRPARRAERGARDGRRERPSTSPCPPVPCQTCPSKCTDRGVVESLERSRFVESLSNQAVARTSSRSGIQRTNAPGACPNGTAEEDPRLGTLQRSRGGERSLQRGTD